MSEDCGIRAASPADYEATCALFDGLDALHREQLPWLFRAPTERPRSQARFDELVSSQRSSILLAEAGGIVGLATVRLQSAPAFAIFIPQDWGVIDDIVVLPAWRRRGIGAPAGLDEAAAAAAGGWLTQSLLVRMGSFSINPTSSPALSCAAWLPPRSSASASACLFWCKRTMLSSIVSLVISR